MANQQLIDFIKSARAKGHADDVLRRGLLEKGWALAEVNAAFFVLKENTTQQNPSFTPYMVPEQKKEISKETPKVKEHNPAALKYIVAGFGILLLLSFTFLIFFYVSSMNDYFKITLETQISKCINPDCSDMKEFALNAAKDKILISLGIALILTALILFIYKLIKPKKIFIWIMNVLYLVVLGILAFLWFQAIK